MKEFLVGRLFKGYEELNDAVREELYGLEAEVWDESLQKLVTGYDNYQHAGGYYVDI